MSQKLVDSYIDKLYAEANLLHSMCGIYPGDPSGDMTLDAITLQNMAEVLSEIDWDAERDYCRSRLPKVTIEVI